MPKEVVSHIKTVLLPDGILGKLVDQPHSLVRPDREHGENRQKEC